MRIIIVGGGRIGEKLADILSKENHEVVVIEKTLKTAMKLSELDILVLHGDATDEKILEEAGIKKADCIVATVRDDKLNLLVSEMAKKAGVEKIIARVSDPTNLEFFIELGAIPINVTGEVISRIYHAIFGVKKEILLSFCGDKMFVARVLITEDSPSVGKRLGELNLKEKIICLERNLESIPLKDEEVLLEGDILYLLASKEEFGRLFSKLVK